MSLFRKLKKFATPLLAATYLISSFGSLSPGQAYSMSIGNKNETAVVTKINQQRSIGMKKETKKNEEIQKKHIISKSKNMEKNENGTNSLKNNLKNFKIEIQDLDNNGIPDKVILKSSHSAKSFVSYNNPLKLGEELIKEGINLDNLKPTSKIYVDIDGNSLDLEDTKKLNKSGKKVKLSDFLKKDEDHKFDEMDFYKGILTNVYKLNVYKLENKEDSSYKEKISLSDFENIIKKINEIKGFNKKDFKKYSDGTNKYYVSKDFPNLGVIKKILNNGNEKKSEVGLFLNVNKKLYKVQKSQEKTISKIYKKDDHKKNYAKVSIKNSTKNKMYKKSASKETIKETYVKIPIKDLLKGDNYFGYEYNAEQKLKDLYKKYGKDHVHAEIREVNNGILDYCILDGYVKIPKKVKETDKVTEKTPTTDVKSTKKGNLINKLKSLEIKLKVGNKNLDSVEVKVPEQLLKYLENAIGKKYINLGKLDKKGDLNLYNIETKITNDRSSSSGIVKKIIIDSNKDKKIDKGDKLVTFEGGKIKEYKINKVICNPLQNSLKVRLNNGKEVKLNNSDLFVTPGYELPKLYKINVKTKIFSDEEEAKKYAEKIKENKLSNLIKVKVDERIIYGSDLYEVKVESLDGKSINISKGGVIKDFLEIQDDISKIEDALGEKEAFIAMKEKGNIVMPLSLYIKLGENIKKNIKKNSNDIYWILVYNKNPIDAYKYSKSLEKIIRDSYVDRGIGFAIGSTVAGNPIGGILAALITGIGSLDSKNDLRGTMRLSEFLEAKNIYNNNSTAKYQLSNLGLGFLTGFISSYIINQIASSGSSGSASYSGGSNVNTSTSIPSPSSSSFNGGPGLP